MQISRLLRALKNRPFALVWSGQTVSLLGDRIFQVALAWWVLEKTGSAVAMGTVFIFSTIPMLVFLLIGGVLVDRFPRLWLMLISDLARGLVIGTVAVLAYLDRLEIWHVYLFSLVFGFVDAFFQPAYRAVMPEVTPADDLTSANSLTSLSGELAGIAGPAAGAAIVALGGTPLAFALDSCSFLASAVCVLPILGLASSPKLEHKSSSVLADLREGLAAVMASPWLWVTILVAGLSNIAYAGPMEVSLPFLIKDYRHVGVGMLGLFYSATAIGSVLATIWLGRLPKLRRRGYLLYGSWALIGIMVIMIGLPVPIPVILIAAAVIGACNATLALAWINSLQEMVPRHLLGRVTSVDYLGSYIFLPLGFAFGGWAAERFGAPLVFIFGGALQTLFVLLGLLHPRVRTVD
jgi:MFS family permease